MRDHDLVDVLHRIEDEFVLRGLALVLRPWPCGNQLGMTSRGESGKEPHGGRFLGKGWARFRSSIAVPGFRCTVSRRCLGPIWR